MSILDICELIGAVIAVSVFYGRMEHRFTRIESKIENLPCSPTTTKIKCKFL